MSSISPKRVSCVVLRYTSRLGARGVYFTRKHGDRRPTPQFGSILCLLKIIPGVTPDLVSCLQFFPTQQRNG